MYFVLMGEWNPREKVIHIKGGGETFQSARTKARAVASIQVKSFNRAQGNP